VLANRFNVCQHQANHSPYGWVLAIVICRFNGCYTRLDAYILH